MKRFFFFCFFLLPISSSVIAVKDNKPHMLRWPDSIYYFSYTQQTQEAIEGEEVTAGEGERGGRVCTYWDTRPGRLLRRPSRCRGSSRTQTDCSAGVPSALAAMWLKSLMREEDRGGREMGDGTGREGRTATFE